MSRWPERTVEERLMDKVIPEPNTGCWLWIGGADKKGYGRMGIEEAGRWVTRICHRVSYVLFVGPIPDGLCVLHHCDVSCCINPVHLFLGTRIDNNLDMRQKGRARWGVNRGEVNGMTKLTEDNVREIRRLRGKVEQRDLGKRFGVSHAVIGAAQRRETWRHVL